MTRTRAPRRSAVKRAPPPNNWVSCTLCGKRSFRTKREAKHAAKAVDHRCRAYPCPGDSNVFHFGHLPTAVIMGDFDRRTMRQMRGQSS